MWDSNFLKGDTIGADVPGIGVLGPDLLGNFLEVDFWFAAVGVLPACHDEGKIIHSLVGRHGDYDLWSGAVNQAVAGQKNWRSTCLEIVVGDVSKRGTK
jgi:hypothetical protein